MSQKLENGIFYTVLILSFLAIVSLFVYFYFDANKDDFDAKSFADKKISVEFDKWNGGWFDFFYKKEKPQNMLPVEEVNIELDKIDGYAPNRKQYNFSVSNIDEYGFFCVKQVLDHHNRPYSYFNKENTLNVNVIVEDPKIMEQILGDLSEYKLNIEVKQ